MKKIMRSMEYVTVAVSALGAAATITSDRRIHRRHEKHLPCKCRSTCLSCLRA
jgi:hypothetical protein